LNAKIEELDFDGPVYDRTFLPDELTESGLSNFAGADRGGVTYGSGRREARTLVSLLTSSESSFGDLYIEGRCAITSHAPKLSKPTWTTFRIPIIDLQQYSTSPVLMKVVWSPDKEWKLTCPKGQVTNSSQIREGRTGNTLPLADLSHEEYAA
jgi:hypothetical protein